MANNFLSDQAIRELRQLYKDVTQIKNRLSRIGVTGPRNQQQLYAEIIAYDSANLGYDATEVLFGGTGPDDWQSIDGGRVWGDQTDEIGMLYAIDSTRADLTGVHPVFRFSDGTQSYWGFIPYDTYRPELSFKHYLEDSTTLRFYDGYVWHGEDSRELVTDGGGFTIGADEKYYVEMSINNNSTSPTVVSTIQSGTITSLLDYDQTTLTKRVLLAETISGDVHANHEGDIYSESLFTPEVNSSIVGDTSNSFDMLGAGAAVDSGDSVDSYFFEGRVIRPKILAGELQDIQDQSAVRFGGSDDDTSMSWIDHINTDTTDEIRFVSKDITKDISSGLVKDWLESDGVDDIVRAIKSLGIEAGGQIYHKNSPVSAESDPDHWFKLTINITGGIVIDDGPAIDSVDLYFDRTGHIWKYNTTSQPPPDDNYRYRHCSDPSTFADLIFDAQQANTVIEVSGECYSEIGTTQEDPTDPAPTVNSTFSTCQLCNDSATNEQWKRCDNDANAAVLSPLHASDDYAWLCLSSVYVKCYNANLTSDTATDPTVLEQCGTTPTQCADLVGWPASDDFGGTGCNSGSVGDTNSTVRWTYSTPGASTAVISGSKLTLTGIANSGRPVTATLRNAAVSGDFAFKVDISNVNVPVSANTQALGLLKVIVGGATYEVGIYNTTGVGGSEGFYINNNGSTTESNTDETGGTAVIRRTGSTITMEIGTISDTAINSSDVSANGVSLGNFVFQDSPTGYTDAIDFDNFVGNDNSGGSGTGTTLRIDPTGQACT